MQEPGYRAKLSPVAIPPVEEPAPPTLCHHPERSNAFCLFRHVSRVPVERNLPIQETQSSRFLAYAARRSMPLRCLPNPVFQTNMDWYSARTRAPLSKRHDGVKMMEAGEQMAVTI